MGKHVVDSCAREEKAEHGASGHSSFGSRVIDAIWRRDEAGGTLPGQEQFDPASLCVLELERRERIASGQGLSRR